MILLIFWTSSAHAQSAASEDDLKAAYIFHFIEFTQWHDKSNEYYLCVPDNEPFRKALNAVLNGKTVDNRRIVVKRTSEFCHILVSDNAAFMPETLTIGLLNHGALFEFRLAGHKLKFAIDRESIKKSNLKISSQLLKLAIMEDNK